MTVKQARYSGSGYGRVRLERDPDSGGWREIHDPEPHRPEGTDNRCWECGALRIDHPADDCRERDA